MNCLDLFPLNVECSIYGMTTFDNNVLVATLDCKIYCITFSNLKPNIREIEFAYIPNGSKIMQLSALKRANEDYVIGITHCKSGIYYFNAYVKGSNQTSLDIDQLAQGCQTIRLKYVPYHLYATETVSRYTKTRQPCWLLSGGDYRLHVFLEDSLTQSFEEKPLEDHFPELDKTFDCPVLWIDIMLVDNMRVTALSFEEGTVKLYCSEFDSKICKFRLISHRQFDDYTTIVPCVRLFRVRERRAPGKLRARLEEPCLVKKESIHDDVNLLIISSTNPCILFRNVLTRGLEIKEELNESQRPDCNTTAAIGDINHDGFNEIVICNYAKELLVYKYNTSSQIYQLDHIQTFNSPLYSIAILNLTGDVLSEVALLLSNGVLILQSSIKDAVEACRCRLELILSRLKI